MQCKVCGQDNVSKARFCANCGATLVTTVEPGPAASEMAVEYMGFWIRFGAAIIDGIALFAISFVFSILPTFGYGAGGIVGIFLYFWLFTGLTGQTPGKMAVGIKVVDAKGNKPGLGIAALREILGKSISAIVLYVGFLWIAFDNKQGWHDKIAGTYVVRVKSRT